MSTSISLISAARQGNATLLQQQLKTIDPEKEKDSQGSTAMHAAAEHNHVDAIELLHQKGAKLVDIANKQGWTPLMEASFRGHSTSMEKLVNLGANSTSSNEQGYTAQALALFRGYKTCAEQLPKDAYTEEFTKRKILAHFCSVGGQSQIGTRKFSLTGAYSPLMHEYVAHDLATFYETEPTFLSNQNKKKILHAYRSASKLKTAAEWTAIIQSGNLTILPAGWDRHAIDLVFYQNYLAICNRGEGVPSGSKTIEAFVIDRTKIDENIIQKILDQKSLSVTKASEFFYKELPKLLNNTVASKKDSLCTRVESIAPKPIKIGICTAGAAKASLRFCLWILRAYSFGRLPPEDFEKKIVSFAKDWSTHNRLERIYHYCASHFKDRQEPYADPDKGLVRVCLSKLSRRIEKRKLVSKLHLLFVSRIAGIRRAFSNNLR